MVAVATLPTPAAWRSDTSPGTLDIVAADNEAELLKMLIARHDRDLPELTRKVDAITETLAGLKGPVAAAELTNVEVLARVSGLERRQDRTELMGRLAWVALSAVGVTLLAVLSAVLPTLLGRFAGG